MLIDWSMRWQWCGATCIWVSSEQVRHLYIVKKESGKEEKVWASSLSPKAAFSTSEVKYLAVTRTADLTER